MPQLNDHQTTKPVIFLAFAQDRVEGGAYLRNLPIELDGVRKALQKARQAGLCEIVERSNTTVENILDVFQEYQDRIAIFHYGGHADSYELLLESLAGEHAAAHREGLVSFLAKQRGLKLVFLNGCSTQRHALNLKEAGIPAMIGTARTIDDAVAADLAVRFYKGLAAGHTIERAWAEAVDQVKMEKGTDWRALHWQGGTETLDRFPWEISYREGADTVKQWNLPAAANSPLFGLPPIPPGDLPPKPYRHLHRFSREHAEIFFGRDQQIRELYNLVTAPHGAPILLLYGQSGVGKSSFLEAGLLPRLEASYEIRYCRRQELGLLATLQQELTSAEKDQPLLQAWCAVEHERQRPLVMILDQVEEVYTRPNEALPNELPDFWQALQLTFANAATRPKGRLILGFRKEWLAEIEKRLSDHALPYHPHFLEPLDRAGLIQAICGPAHTARLQQRYGLRLAEGLPEIMADSLLEDRDSPLAPMLQILLTKMWDQATQHRRSHPIFDHDLYNRLRKPKSFLQHFLLDQLEVALRRWRPEVVDSGLALDVLYFHTTSDGTAQQRTAQETEQKYGHRGDVLPGLIQQCKDLYLLVDPAADQPDAGLAQATRLTHDTLAPLVRKLHDESPKPGQRAARVLSSKLSIYGTGIALLGDAELKTIEDGRSGMRQLTSDEKSLLSRSQEEQQRRRLHEQEMLEKLKYSEDEVIRRIQELGYFDKRKNPGGKGIKHQYKTGMRHSKKFVVDQVTGLMWQQRGSDKTMDFADAQDYVQKLNRSKFAGFGDWRMPNLEEAMSLMEPTESREGLHIDPVFDKALTWIWTSSKPASGVAWVVYFDLGHCNQLNVDFFGNYVRAVRSGQS